MLHWLSTFQFYGSLSTSEPPTLLSAPLWQMLFNFLLSLHPSLPPFLVSVSNLKTWSILSTMRTPFVVDHWSSTVRFQSTCPTHLPLPLHLKLTAQTACWAHFPSACGSLWKGHSSSYALTSFLLLQVTDSGNPSMLGSNVISSVKSWFFSYSGQN